MPTKEPEANTPRESQTAKSGRPKSAQKRHNILVAAEKLILDLGYSATSMDLVATEAGVSKQTVYSHFKSKDALFKAIIVLKCSQHQLNELQEGTFKQNTFDVLYNIGMQVTTLLLQKEVVKMYRVVIAEVANNPNVAKLFYETGPQHSVELIAEYLHRQTEISVSKEASYMLAVNFLNMLKGDYHMRLILGLECTLSEEEIKSNVFNAVSSLIKLMTK